MERLCLNCRQPENDAEHRGSELGEEAHAWDARIEQHVYDPGERRKMVRRMTDRVHILEDAQRRISGE